MLGAHFPDKLDLGRASIMGHSMGGHGALVLALRNPGRCAKRGFAAPADAYRVTPSSLTRARPTRTPCVAHAHACILLSL